MNFFDRESIKEVKQEVESRKKFVHVHLSIFIFSAMCALIYEYLVQFPAKNNFIYIGGSIFNKISVTIFTGYIFSFFTDGLPKFDLKKKMRPEIRKKEKDIKDRIKLYDKAINLLKPFMLGRAGKGNLVYKYNGMKVYFEDTSKNRKILNSFYSLRNYIKKDADYLVKHKDYLESTSALVKLLELKDIQLEPFLSNPEIENNILLDQYYFVDEEYFPRLKYRVDKNYIPN